MATTPQDLGKLLAALRSARDPWTRLRLVAGGARALSRLTQRERRELLRKVGLEGAEELADLAGGGDETTSAAVEQALRSLEANPQRLQRFVRDLAQPESRRATLAGLAAHVLEVVTEPQPAPPEEAPAAAATRAGAAAGGAATPAKASARAAAAARPAAAGPARTRTQPGQPSRPAAPDGVAAGPARPAPPRPAGPPPGGGGGIAVAAAPPPPAALPPPAPVPSGSRPAPPPAIPAAGHPPAASPPASAPGERREAPPRQPPQARAAQPPQSHSTLPQPSPPRSAGWAATTAKTADRDEDDRDDRGPLAALQGVRRQLAEGRPPGREELAAVLESELTSDWARRRALAAVFASGVPPRAEEALALVEGLATAAARRWALADLAGSRRWSDDDFDRVLAAADTPGLRRRLANRRPGR